MDGRAAGGDSAAASGRRPGTEPRQVRLRYPPEPESCSRVRRDVRECLAAWGLDEETTETVEMVANELASNAVDHARSPFVLVLTLEGRELRVEVTDASAAEPRLRPHDVTAARGRGLQIVDALSARWAFHRNETGKTVAAMITLHTGVAFP